MIRGQNADEHVEDETPVFTEGDVYMIAGFLATRWGVWEEMNTDDVGDAIQDILSAT